MEKWPFLDLNHGLTPLKKCQFFAFLKFFFLYSRKVCFRSRISQKTFSWTILPKKQSWKIGHFWTKTMGQPLWKNVNFSTFRTCCFYCLESRFLLLEYRKRHFPGLNCQKKKVGKMAIFGLKAWVNPFKKMSIFRLFEILFFIF